MELELRREQFLTQYPPFYVLNTKEIKHVWDKKELHLYVHLPFCARRCDFCYYKSFPYKSKSILNDYLEALKKEIELYSLIPEIKTRIVRSIYFGGGTPTLLSEKQLEDLITNIKTKFEFANEVEICCEARPGEELTLTKLGLLKDLGVNRLSVGCQSLDDQVLSANGRNHSVAGFYRAMDKIQKTKFNCLNIDLMSGMIAQSYESWMETIKLISDIRPENITIYKMELFLNNKLYQRYRNGEINLMPDTEETRHIKASYNWLMDNGFTLIDHISFVTDPRFIHIQRRETWKGYEMLGVGLSSHSYFNNHIFQNTTEFNNYINAINNGNLAIYRAHKVSVNERMIKHLVFGIKNLKLSRTEFKNEFGIDILVPFGDKLNDLKNRNLINITDDEITVPFDGAIFADDIIKIFFLPEHKHPMLAHVRREFN